MLRNFCVLLFLCVVSILLVASPDFGLMDSGTVRLTGGYKAFSFQMGVLSFLEAGWSTDAGTYFKFGFDRSFHITGQLSVSGPDVGEVILSTGYDFGPVWLSLGALYKTDLPAVSFLGGYLYSAFSADNQRSYLALKIGRYQELQPDPSVKRDFTSIDVSAGYRSPLDINVLVSRLVEAELIFASSWEINDDLSDISIYPTRLFAGIGFTFDLKKILND